MVYSIDGADRHAFRKRMGHKAATYPSTRIICTPVLSWERPPCWWGARYVHQDVDCNLNNLTHILDMPSTLSGIEVLIECIKRLSSTFSSMELHLNTDSQGSPQIYHLDHVSIGWYTIQGELDLNVLRYETGYSLRIFIADIHCGCASGGFGNGMPSGVKFATCPFRHLNACVLSKGHLSHSFSCSWSLHDVYVFLMHILVHSNIKLTISWACWKIGFFVMVSFWGSQRQCFGVLHWDPQWHGADSMTTFWVKSLWITTDVAAVMKPPMRPTKCIKSISSSYSGVMTIFFCIYYNVGC